MGIGRSWGSKEAWEEAGRKEDRGHGSGSKWKRAAEKRGGVGRQHHPQLDLDCIWPSCRMQLLARCRISKHHAQPMAPMQALEARARVGLAGSASQGW